MVSTDIISGRNLGRAGYPQHVRDLFIGAYATSGNVRAACTEAGISYESGRNWLRDPGFVSEVTKYRQRALAVDAAGIAYGVLVEIMVKAETDPDGRLVYYAPVSERRQAAKTVLELAGHTPALGEALAKISEVAALHDLTEEQLEAHIKAGQELLGNLRESGATPSVAPNAAAQGLL
jgi:hypothetical protein